MSLDDAAMPAREPGAVWVYVFTVDDVLCKVGYSIQPAARLAVIRRRRSAWRVCFWCAYRVVADENNSTAQFVEAQAHVELGRKHRIGGEWFYVPPQVAEHAVVQAVRGHGLALRRFPELSP